VIRDIVESSENTIVESNSIMQFWKPDLYIVVLDFQTQDFKESALRYLDRADCLVPGGRGRAAVARGVAAAVGIEATVCRGRSCAIRGSCAGPTEALGW
jgi:hypothetical protein